MSTNSIAFPEYYDSSAVTISATVTVQCTSSTAFTVGLNGGTSTGATDTNRSLHVNGTTAPVLGYGLFSDAAYTVNWGNTAATGWWSATGTNLTKTIYARIPANQYAAADNYSDRVTATLYINGNAYATNTIHVSATVGNGCALSAGALNFGNYSGSLVSGQSTITATCTKSTTYNVGLNAGTATGATVTTRKMQNGKALLQYALSHYTSMSPNWGNTIGSDTVVGTGTGSAQNLTVYGQIPAGQSVASGSYTDTITVTLTY
jgi:spore coat protein U-like protein